MKNIICFFLLILGLINLSFSQNCNHDSIVTKLNYEDDILYEIETDSFNILAGSMKYYQKDFSSNGNATIYRGTGTFTRTYIERTSFGDTSEYYSFKGNGSGYDNYRKIIINYDPVTNKIFSRQQFNGSGTLWLSTKQENFTYDLNNNLIEYICLVDDGSGVGILENSARTNFNFTGLRLDTILYQTGQGSIWENNYRYVISYNASDLRDTLALENWDSTMVMWTDSAKYNYEPTNDYTVQLWMSKTYFDSASSFWFTDTINLELDTFNLKRSYYYDLDRNVTKGQYDYLYIGDNELVNFQSTDDYGCFIESYNGYDQNGVLTSWAGPSTCFMPAYHSGSYSYDSLYRSISSHTYSSVGSGDYYSSKHWYYANANPNSIFFEYATMEDFNYPYCIGDSANTGAIVCGGCGAYHFQWTPLTGLSSDTVREPLIFLTDTTTYSITVTDSLGNSATTSFFATPFIVASLTVDSTSTPFILTAHYYCPDASINAGYQWFRNDTAIAGATNQNYSIMQDGIYRVKIRTFSFNQCVAFSEEFIYIINKINDVELNSISIYPNPAKELLMIKGLPLNAIVSVLDLTGRKLELNGNWNSEEYTIDTSTLDPSIYVIDISTKNAHIHKSIAKVE